ncbi:glycosyltransferase family 2 protein [Kribbella sp. CA-293567]|uniref:glycosyltransferase family 2 protein n=1 Tax=Kribbella sp. CA-293567 TaxID=3002436 RepID=UPI0022DE7AC4|nr:glycosyltransferase [Kribbella sp. CA-293567]WBQ03890.1 glycosyltransferase [Kribbella sp. CA-293567]
MCPEQVPATNHESPVTVVVASRNRRSELLQTLGCHAAPVILIDNGSADGTADAVEQAYPAVRVVRLSSNQGAPARNLGVALATTPYVAFADDDSWWEPGALEAAAEILDKQPTLGLLAARILLGQENTSDPLNDLMADSPLQPDPGGYGKPILGFAACAAVVRRDAFLVAQGFDPVVFFGGEEERLALDLAAAGWELCYAPELVVHHHPSPSRGKPQDRELLILRNRLLTATMRRPWPVVLREAWRAVRHGSVGLRATLTAVPRLPAALAARHRVPTSLEQRLSILEASQTDRAASGVSR